MIALYIIPSVYFMKYIKKQSKEWKILFDILTIPGLLFAMRDCAYQKLQEKCIIWHENTDNSKEISNNWMQENILKLHDNNERPTTSSCSELVPVINSQNQIYCQKCKIVFNRNQAHKCAEEFDVGKLRSRVGKQTPNT
jgi:hypothetical protein